MNVVTKQDKVDLYHLMQYIKVDINDLIFNHIAKIARQRTKTYYLYGMLMTRLITNKGTVLNSKILNMTLIISIATLEDLKMKNDSGFEFTSNHNLRITENLNA